MVHMVLLTRLLTTLHGRSAKDQSSQVDLKTASCKLQLLVKSTLAELIVHWKSASMETNELAINASLGAIDCVKDLMLSPETICDLDTLGGDMLAAGNPLGWCFKTLVLKNLEEGSSPDNLASLLEAAGTGINGDPAEETLIYAYVDAAIHRETQRDWPRLLLKVLLRNTTFWRGSLGPLMAIGRIIQRSNSEFPWTQYR